jgi:uncharacterized membrane protein YphA (DoxX/SURF4 family)
MIRISTWTAIFLVLLRIVIGWHFAYEGATKVKSAYQGKGSGEKVFTSENYFRESEGPFGKLVKGRIGDPDQEVIDKLTLKPVDGDVSDASPSSRFPDAMAKEWDDYLNRFVTQFRLDDEQKSEAQKKVDQAKAKYVNWVQGNSDQMDPATKKPKRILLKVKRKAPGINNQSSDYDEEMTVGERAAELKKKSDEVKEAYKKMAELGRDVDAVALRAKKTDVASIRVELQKEIDGQTKAMKDDLAKLLDTRVTAYAAEAGNRNASATLEAMLTPMINGSNPLGKMWEVYAAVGSAAAVFAIDRNNPLAKMWDDYAAFVKDFAPGISDEQKTQVDEELRSAKVRFDRWLADKDMYTGAELKTKDVADWRANYKQAQAKLNVVADKDKNAEALAKEEIDVLTKRMQSELKSQSDAMRAQIGTPLLGEDRAKGYAAKNDDRYLWIFPKGWSLIDYIDWSTRWFLLVVGGLLMIGLFTRLSCFAAAGFLLLTILTQPSLPWIPAAPMNEGSYLFVNKNVIEMVALLALMTTRCGQWAGLDSIVSWMFGRRREVPVRRLR